MHGFLLIDKPTAVTSFHVTAIVRKKAGIKRVGHAGTLDPLATGVLPVMLGQATRFCDLLPIPDKRYQATFKLGITTDTLDITGTFLSECKVNVNEVEVSDALAPFRGEIMQIPPMYSAISKNGVRLYELARKGIEVERDSRKVTIYSLELLSGFNDEYVIDVHCSKGTYIRTLIDDIGRSLGCGAVMTALRRTQGNGFSIDDCISLETFINGDIKDYLLPADKALTQYSQLSVTPAQEKRFLNGGSLDLIRVTLPKNPTQLLRVYGEKFLGLGELDFANEQINAKCVLNEE